VVGEQVMQSFFACVFDAVDGKVFEVAFGFRHTYLFAALILYVFVTVHKVGGHAASAGVVDAFVQGVVGVVEKLATAINGGDAAGFVEQGIGDAAQLSAVFC